MTDAAHAAHRHRAAKRLALICFLTFVTLPGHGQESVRPSLEDRGMPSAFVSGPVLGVTAFRGRTLHYEVIDGMAIHAGDMVLGPAEEAAAASNTRKPTKRDLIPWLDRRNISAIEEDYRWPDGRVPYVIDPDVRDPERIHEAIEEWNSKTVITLLPRTAEPDYVRFQFAESGNCRSRVGKVGGEQAIRVPRFGCSTSTFTHEIGHAVGLWHEHEREDRDEYLMVLDENRVNAASPALIADHPASGPYDYLSVMHYSALAFSDNGKAVLETIPPGMPLRIGRLSAGDIDGVARMYGMPPSTTTVSANPPGLDVIVDGIRVTTPATFTWLPGSDHTLEAPSPQSADDNRYLFGRWNDNGDQKHTVKADPDSTWFEANFIEQRPVSIQVDPPDAGTVTVNPESPDGFHVLRSTIEVTAAPARGKPDRFLRWATDGSLFSLSGGSSSPASFLIRRPRPAVLTAFFRTPPFYRFNSNAGPLGLYVNSRRHYTPTASFPLELPASSNIWVPETQQAPFGEGRYRFSEWSDSGERRHDIDVPESGGSLTVDVLREFSLRVASRSNISDAEIVISPESENDYYAADTQVQITAVPAPGGHFAGWGGDASGTETVQSVVMDQDRFLEAVFTASEPLRLGEPKEILLATSDDSDARFFGATGYNVGVPPDATEVTIRFESSTTANVDLFAKHRWEIERSDANNDEESEFDADFSATGPAASETLVITREPNRLPIKDLDDRYYIALSVGTTDGEIRGMLSVSIKRHGIAWVSPRAFTYVSPFGSSPRAQSMRIAHSGTDPFRYRIVSDQQWLTASPPEWSHTESGTVEITVMANGGVLAAGSHRGKLRILTVGDGDPPTGGSPTGIEIPVAFAVTPLDRSE